MKDITPIISAIITLLLALITTFVIPYLKTKISASDFEKIKAWVKIAVQAVELIYPEAGQGRVKKQAVIDFLIEHNVVFDESQIDMLIESAVLELKNELLQN